MDDPKRKRGRPRKVNNNSIDAHIRVEKYLIDAVQKPGCNLSNTIRRALRMYLKIEDPDNLKALAVRIKDIKSEIAGLNRELLQARNHAKILGVKDMDEFEDSLEGWSL